MVAARDKKLVTKGLPAFIARTQFGQILERVSGNRERFLVTKKGEAKAIAAFEKDPYGAGDDLGKKRDDRNPFCRISPYPGSCSELVGILHHRGPSLYEGKLPWL